MQLKISRAFSAALALLLPALVVLNVHAADRATPANSTRPAVWWKWDLQRHWTTDARIARATVSIFSDAQRTQPFPLEQLRLTVRIECPALGRPQIAKGEAAQSATVTAEILCPSPGEPNFDVKWDFEAVDPRIERISDGGRAP